MSRVAPHLRQRSPSLATELLLGRPAIAVRRGDLGAAASRAASAARAIATQLPAPRHTSPEAAELPLGRPAIATRADDCGATRHARTLPLALGVFAFLFLAAPGTSQEPAPEPDATAIPESIPARRAGPRDRDPIERLRLGVSLGSESAATGEWSPDAGAASAEPPSPTAEQIERGRALYANGTCTTCHHYEGRGSRRAPALDDAVWLHGDGSLAAIRAVLLAGVPRAEHRGPQTPYEMRPLGGMELDAAELDSLAAYVWSLSRGTSPAALLADSASAGEALVPTAADPITTIAFGSCAHQDEPQPIWSSVLARAPDLFLLLGDNVYADAHDDAERRAAWAKLAAKPGFAKLRESLPVLATWDDHDYGTDDAGAELPEKEASRDAFLDFLGEPDDSPRRSREGVYEAYRFGPPGRVVQVILLDTRWSRGPLRVVGEELASEEKRAAARERREAQKMGPYEPSSDRGARLLGEEQWAWLEDRLREPAELRLIATSIPFAMEFTGWETWANFPFERRRLISLIADTGAEGVLFLSGDTHWADLSLIERGALGAPYALWDLTSSGLTEEWHDVSPNRRRVGKPHVGANFGVIEILWDATPPEDQGSGSAPGVTVRLEIRGLGGQVVSSRRVTLRGG